MFWGDLTPLGGPLKCLGGLCTTYSRADYSRANMIISYSKTGYKNAAFMTEKCKFFPPKQATYLKLHYLIFLLNMV